MQVAHRPNHWKTENRFVMPDQSAVRLITCKLCQASLALRTVAETRDLHQVGAQLLKISSKFLKTGLHLLTIRGLWVRLCHDRGSSCSRQIAGRNQLLPTTTQIVRGSPNRQPSSPFGIDLRVHCDPFLPAFHIHMHTHFLTKP